MAFHAPSFSSSSTWPPFRKPRPEIHPTLTACFGKYYNETDIHSPFYAPSLNEFNFPRYFLYTRFCKNWTRLHHKTHYVCKFGMDDKLGS